MPPQNRYAFVLVSYFISINFISKEWHFVFLCVILCYLILNIKIEKHSFIFLLPIIPLGWGLMFSIGNEWRDIIRDSFYLLMPSLIILFGILLSYRLNLAVTVKIILLLAFLDSFRFIFKSIVELGPAFLQNPVASRLIVGIGSPFFALGSLFPVIIWIHPNALGFQRNRITLVASFLMSILALYLSGSRTSYVIFILSIIILLYFKNIRIFLFINTLLLVISIMIYPYFTRSNNLLAKKILNSYNEIRMDNFTTKNVADNYRGFETGAAFNQFLKSDIIEKTFGAGIGRNIDLGEKVLLGDKNRRVIPILHNGYLYVLIKIGISGLLFYFLFFYKILKKANSLDKYSSEQFVIKVIIYCAILSLLISNYVVSSFFYTNSPLMFLLGYAYGYTVQLEFGSNGTNNSHDNYRILTNP